MSHFDGDSPEQPPEESGGLVVLLRLGGAFVALTGGSGLGLLATKPEGELSWFSPWLVASALLTLLGLVAALGAWTPRLTLKLLGIGGAVAALVFIASVLLS